MKSDKEMVESILHKAHEKENRMNRTKKIMSGTLAVIVAVMAVGGVGVLQQKNKTVNTTPDTTPGITSEDSESITEKRIGSLTLLIASAAETEEEEEIITVNHGADVQLPVQGKLVIEKVTGMTDEEKNHYHAKLNDQLNYNWQLTENSNHIGNSFHIGGAESENYVGSLAFEGRFIIFVEDQEALENINITCGEFGRFELHAATINGKVPLFSEKWRESFKFGKNISITGDEYSEIYLNTYNDDENGQDGVFVSYDISQELLEAKETNPDLSYEDVSDDLVFTANFKDGSSESYKIHITFDAAGNLTANYAE